MDRSIQSRVVFGLMLTIAFGIAPSLMVGMLMLQNIGIEGSIAEPGPGEYAYSLAVVALLLLVLVLIPSYPLSMTVVFDKKFSRLLNALTIIGAVFLALPAVFLVNSGDVAVFKESVFNYALFSLIIGMPGFILILSALFTSKIDAMVEDMLNHVRVWRSLHLYRSSVLEERSEEKD